MQWTHWWLRRFWMIDDYFSQIRVVICNQRGRSSGTKLWFILSLSTHWKLLFALPCGSLAFVSQKSRHFSGLKRRLWNYDPLILRSWSFNMLWSQEKMAKLHALKRLPFEHTKGILAPRNTLVKYRGFRETRAWATREFKKRGRRRQREHHKTIRLMSKNNRSARASYILVHFFTVLCKTRTWFSRFSRERERMTAKSSFFFLTLTSFILI